MNLEPGIVITILGGVLTVGVSWGIVTTRLGAAEKESTKNSVTNENDHVKLEKRIERMESEIATEIKEKCQKFETELCEFERKFERCKEGRTRCQHEVSQELWKYVKGDDELPRFVPMSTYKTDKTTVQNRLTAIEERNTQQHQQIMLVLQDIQARVGG
jgi:hypothetical protein